MVRDYDDEDNYEDQDYMQIAQDELKRVDHQVYVTLKYTRTVDVLLNVLTRMVDAYSAMINSLLTINKKEDEELPVSVLEKVNKINEVFNDPQVQENMNLYLLMKKVIKAKNITKASEYRRPVNLRTVVDGQEVMVDIDAVTHYYAIMMSFYKYVELLFRNEFND